MKRIMTLLVLCSLGLALPLSVRAQDNDAARIAMQKRNAKRSRKDVRAGKHTLKKMQKSMGKPKKQGKPDDQSAAAGLPPA
ncbi:MAG: hypothetical protein WA294_15290 [Acidobacteriaceae bacterium]